MEVLEEKVSKLEEMMMRLLYIQQKTEMEIQSLSREIKEYKQEVDKQIRDMNKKWGEISNKLGTIVEDIIFPAAKPVLEKYFNCEITDIHMNRKRKKDNLKDEFDVIAVSDPCKTVYLIEVKATPKIDYINEFKDEKLERFKALFPEYEDYKLIPIFASLRLEDDIINYLTKNKIYAMAYREWEYMDILNFDEIK
jgi:transcription elongation factor Elf1